MAILTDLPPGPGRDKSRGRDAGLPDPRRGAAVKYKGGSADVKKFRPERDEIDLLLLDVILRL